MTNKNYTIEYDGKKLSRKNDGFHLLELLGLLEKIQLEILQQMAGSIKPEVIKRQVVKSASKKTKQSKK